MTNENVITPLKVSLWANFLGRMTDLKVEEIKDEIDTDTGTNMLTKYIYCLYHCTL